MNAHTMIDKMMPAALILLIDQNHSAKQAAMMKLFAAQYFATTSKAELQRRGELALYQTLLSAWNFYSGSQGTVSASRKGGFTVRIGMRQQVQEDGEEICSIQVITADRPFLVDSIRHQLTSLSVSIKSINNTVLLASRSDKGRTAGKLNRLQSPAHVAKEPASRLNLNAESMIDFHCESLSKAKWIQVERLIQETIDQVVAATEDYGLMCSKLRGIQRRLLKNRKSLPVAAKEYNETDGLMTWLLDDHFTFLGYEKYQISYGKADKAKAEENVNLAETQVVLDRKSMLGVSRWKQNLKTRVKLSALPKQVAAHILAPRLCSFAKSATRSMVHRATYYDYVLLKEFDHAGRVIVEHRFVGLYTSSVYHRDALSIPLLRHKVSQVLEKSGFAPKGHSIKDLQQVINVLPREELFQMSQAELHDTAMQITQIQEIKTTRLFVRPDSYGRFYSCLIYVPREYYSTDVRQKAEAVLLQALNGDDVEFDVQFSESLHARVHLVVRAKRVDAAAFHLAELEQRLVKVIKPWQERLIELIRSSKQTELKYAAEAYNESFPVAFKEAYTVQEALHILLAVEKSLNSEQLNVQMVLSEHSQNFNFRLTSPRQSLMLSDVAPILENMGCTVVAESSYEIRLGENNSVFLHDFSLRHDGNSTADKSLLSSAETASRFEEGFQAIWHSQADDDRFNALILTTNLQWREVALLRAYAAYMKQINRGYSHDFIAATLVKYSNITCELLACFKLLFDSQTINRAATEREKQYRHGVKKALKKLDDVENLTEDSVLRTYFDLVSATQRTNYFQEDDQGHLKSYFSFKFSPKSIPGMPQPKPEFEIFVFSPELEGVHLRGGKVARGGLRWSDRLEDYRTEVLGLVKAQQVKNSVIVPVGAKGGFVVKRPISNATREQFMAQGVACYQTFISALLDITDNYSDTAVVRPKQVLCRDEEDPYLVVAADKGTATFSDIANKIAETRGFWMGDGFASGGSNGYDHKKMGITAKGAWVSVQRHFREMGKNIQKEEFTVVGIGDMSGDVFGNGMLLSKHIQLLAAFNHLHIFVDPNPNPATTFRERQRLFRKPRSSWSDFDNELISSGGGVFSRSAKAIAISPEMQARFGINEKSLTPDSLITALLKSEVDLLWNGGIGTYVKASSESHNEVGDKTNDGLRVNGNELRCKVIGEGGNLGFTQKARIEYGLNGGVSFTDFIDNSAGVDCSDHEVNIKILLSQLLAQGKLKPQRRNKLLAEMTEAIAEQVLDNNYHQVQALGLAQSQSGIRTREYAGLLSFLEEHAGLDRGIEYLPSQEDIEERVTRGDGLTRPELAVLNSYMKMFLKAELSKADYINDDYLLPALYSAFPGQLVKHYGKDIASHQLRPEIVATQLANSAVNFLGANFVYRMSESCGASPADIVKASVIAREVYQVDKLWQQIEDLDYAIDADLQNDMMVRVVRLMRRVTRWLLRNRRSDLNFDSTLKYFSKTVNTARRRYPEVLPEQLQQKHQADMSVYTEAGVPESLAATIAGCQYLHSLMSIAEIEAATDASQQLVLKVFYGIGDTLDLNWLARLINELPVSSYWQALARESFQDDLEWQQRALTENIVVARGSSKHAQQIVTQWRARHSQAIGRSSVMLKQLQREGHAEYPMFSVTLRELFNLAQSTAHG